MAAPIHAQEPSAEHFFETLNAYQQTEALKAAIELDLFTAIGEGGGTSAELAELCRASERGIRILCDYLVVIGFLNKGENRYGLTPDSAKFLDRRSPACMATIARFIISPTLTGAFRDVAAAVRKGGTVMSEEGMVAPEHPVWVEFARAMAPMMALPAELIAGLVGANAGEKWKVLDVARENAKAAGVSGRYRTIAGSAFDVDYGSGYNLALLTNFLHHFDVSTCESLLRKIHAALAPGGRAVAYEFVPDEDRVSPPVAAKFSLMMLGTTPSGDAYTFSEYERMFRNAGFKASELHPLPPTPERIVISRK